MGVNKMIQAAELAEKAYPDSEAVIVIPYNDKYYVSIKTPENDLGLADFHEVDLKTGRVSDYISVIDLTEDPEFDRLLSKTRPFKKRGLFRTLWNKGPKMGR